MDNNVVYNGQNYPLDPGYWQSFKEAFMPTDQRAQLEAQRQMVKDWTQQKVNNQAQNAVDASPWLTMQGGQ